MGASTRSKRIKGRGLWAWLLALGLLGGCEPGGEAGLGNPQQGPIITRFEVFPNPQNPGRGPFELLAYASGEGVLTFSWSATGGVLSVASQSATASAAPLIPSFSAWDPPGAWGIYEVSVIVTDSGGGSYRRIARFEVTPEITRLLF